MIGKAEGAMALARVETSKEAATTGSAHASLLEISQAIGSSLELSAVLDTFLELTLREMQAQQGSILLFDEQQDQLQMLASKGLPDTVSRKGYIPRKGSIAEFVIQNNQPLIMNDAPTHAAYQAMDYRRINSSMCVPLRARGKVLGTINLNRTDSHLSSFVQANLEVMTILAAQAAIFIENSRLHESNMKAERLAAIGQTVAGISHCVKNVLTGVKGGMSLVDLARQNQDWNLANQGGDILKRNLDRLSSIVLDMLDFSKERVPMTSSVLVASVLDEVKGTVESSAKQKNIEIRIQIDPPRQWVQADAQQLYRCILNLAHNAIDAMSVGGTIVMSSAPSSEPAALRHVKQTGVEAVIVLRVRDDGPGIAEENAKTIFEPFFSTKGSKGTGLGLAVTRKIVEEHGGSIVLETYAPDPACFAIYLPQANP
jgi:signal transduction histidine kinase